MNKFLDQIGDKLLPLANKLAANRYLTVLRDAFMLSFPLTMFGSIVVVFNNLPFFNDATKATLSNLFGSGQNATMSIMTVFRLQLTWLWRTGAMCISSASRTARARVRWWRCRRWTWCAAWRRSSLWTGRGCSRQTLILTGTHR